VPPILEDPVRLTIYAPLGVSDGISLEEMRAIGSAPLTVAKDTRLTMQSVSPTHVYWIESGVVKIHALAQDGAETITALRTCGWIVGAVALLMGSPSESTATAATELRVYAIKSDVFLKANEESEALARHVSKMLALEFAVRLQANAALRQLGVRARLEHFFEEFAQSPSCAGEPLRLRLKQTEIAQLLATSPEYLSRLIAELEVSGVVNRSLLQD
jgi:CRP/FNR family cyclic AMP-dependent transcriptional regulator